VPSRLHNTADAIPGMRRQNRTEDKQSLMDGQAGRLTDRQADRLTGRQTNKQADMQHDRQTD